MSTMSTHISSVPRRARLGAVIASLFAIAGVLAGCSSGDYPESAAGAPVEEMAADGGDMAYADGEEGAPSTANRSVIITGSMYMTVENPIAAADQAAGIVQQAGGRIDARSETAPDEWTEGSAALTMRIPSEDLDAVVDDLRKLGTVDEYSTDSTDVTVEVTDLEARISTLRASTERIEALLVEAKDISDIITLENELANRQAELESLEARQRGLDDQVSMSTIYLSLTTEPVVIVDEDSPDSFWDGLVAGWNGLVSFISVALVAFGVMLPWLIVMALIALVVILLVRRNKSRKASRADAAPTAPTPPPAPAEPAQLAVPPTKK